MTVRGMQLTAVALLAVQGAAGHAQDRFAGSAVVRTDQTEYVVPIECDDAARPEAGFSTEPARITREATGRTSGINVRLRQWQDSDEVVVSLDRYVAWMPRPASQAGVLSLTVAMSPTSVTRDGAPVLLTYDMWISGDRPAGIEVQIEANCASRDPAAPASRRLP